MRSRVGPLARRLTGTDATVLLPVAGPDDVAAADAAGRAALPGGAPAGDAGPADAVTRLDAVALRAMASVLDAGDPDVAPRHAWLVRRWRAELAAHGDPGPQPDGALHAACTDLGYPPAMVEFFAAAMAHLPELLRDEVPLQALLFPDGEIATALASYQDDTINTYLNGALAHLAATTARTRAEPLRVLELGGGVGGSTRAVLDGLGEAPVDYLFTDISRFFLDLAATRFPGVRTALLDVTTDLAAHDGRHDLVVAANVLHNAVDVRATLAAVRGVLAPGGVLALVESTREHLPALVSMQFLMSARPGAAAAGSGDRRAGTDRIFLTERRGGPSSPPPVCGRSRRCPVARTRCGRWGSSCWWRRSHPAPAAVRCGAVTSSRRRTPARTHPRSSPSRTSGRSRRGPPRGAGRPGTARPGWCGRRRSRGSGRPC